MCLASSPYRNSVRWVLLLFLRLKLKYKLQEVKDTAESIQLLDGKAGIWFEITFFLTPKLKLFYCSLVGHLGFTK